MKARTRNRLIYFFIVFVLIVTAFVIFFQYIFSEGEYALKQSIIDDESFSNKPFPEYSKDLKFAKGLDFKIAVYSKTRSPIEKFVYKNYIVYLYQLPVKNNKPLSQILKIKKKDVSPPTNSHFNELTNSYGSTHYDKYYTEHDNCEIVYSVGKPRSGSEINLTLSGPGIKVFKTNDNSYTCDAFLGNFSINYDHSDTIDFYGEIKSNAKMLWLPIQITFEKKNEHFYMVLMLKKE